MRKFKNKETGIINSDTGTKCTYSTLMNIVINQGKAGGFDYADIEKRLAISEAIKKAESKQTIDIELEDDKFQYLKELILTTKWPFFHQDLLIFKEDIVK